MIYSITGTVAKKTPRYVVVENHGIGYKVFVSVLVSEKIPLREPVTLYCYQHIREDMLDLYGFLEERALELYEELLNINGVGPRSGLAIMDVDTLDHIIAGINEGRVDLLSRASGVGKKTAERIVLELKGKLAALNTKGTISKMERDIELEETLVGLGYGRGDARTAIEALDPTIEGFQERLREVLKKK